MSHRARAWRGTLWILGVSLFASRVPAQQLPARIESISAGLLGRPYQLDPLGEGEQGRIDRDPLIRFDVFDCLTYVETVLAMARARDATDIATQLSKIRYRDAVIGYATRNHFPEADWLPANIAQHVVVDITAQVAAQSGVALSVAAGTIDRRSWLLQLPSNPLQASNPLLAPGGTGHAEILALAAAAVSTAISIRYVRLREAPQSALQRLAAQLPSAAIVFIVRPNTSMLGQVGSNTLLSHVGFVIQRPGVTLYRSASSGRAHAVIDQALVKYLQRAQRSRSFAGILVVKAESLP